MIDFRNEEVIPLGEVPALLPKRRGKKVHISTIYRWAKSGVYGHRLETIKVGGATCTSTEALQRFFNAISDETQDPVPELVRSPRRAARTDEVLRDAGL